MRRRTLYLYALAGVMIFGLAGAVQGADNPLAGAKFANPGACSLCHQEQAGPWPETVHGKGSAGGPGVDCLACHQFTRIHATPVTPQNSAERCGSCHMKSRSGSPGKNSARTGSLLDDQAWMEKGHGGHGLTCTDCHSVHSAASSETILKAGGKELCLGCHREVLQHQGPGVDQQAVKVKVCTVCHDPHGGSSGILLRDMGRAWDFGKKYKHKPVADGKCNDCHTPHLVASGKVTEENVDDRQDQVKESASSGRGLLVADRSALCGKCHGKTGKRLEGTPHAQIRGLEGSDAGSPCLACHSAHTSDYKGLTKLPGNTLCLACHPGYAPHHFLSAGKVKQADLACVSCHRPHGTGVKNFLPDTANLCARCHKQ